MAVVTLATYPTFLQKWEALSKLLLDLLNAQDDPNLSAILSRSRAASVAFGGVQDDSTSKPVPKSSLDIGSFLETFKTQCGPTAALAKAIDEALSA